MVFRNSLRLFRLFGIDVYVNWSWVIAPIIIVGLRRESMPVPTVWYASVVCLALFGIVLLHEFGHALACKSVGGRAERIVLWPLGGVAFVQPPPRPGAVLWSIAAGPLVNVALIPVTALLVGVAFFATGSLDAPASALAVELAWVNVGLLIFNVMPIYPLDGGQILQSLLWFLVGRPASLVIAAGIGLAGGGLLALLCLLAEQWWLGLMAVFMVMQSVAGIRQGMAMLRVASLPRYPGPRCPACGESPPMAAVWMCGCGERFDLFANRGVCPRCTRFYPVILCPLCWNETPAGKWFEGTGVRAVV